MAMVAMAATAAAEATVAAAAAQRGAATRCDARRGVEARRGRRDEAEARYGDDGGGGDDGGAGEGDGGEGDGDACDGGGGGSRVVRDPHLQPCSGTVVGGSGNGDNVTELSRASNLERSSKGLPKSRNKILHLSGLATRAAWRLGPRYCNATSTSLLLLLFSSSALLELPFFSLDGSSLEHQLLLIMAGAAKCVSQLRALVAHVD